MSIYKLNVPQILAALAATDSAGPAMDGSVIKLDCTAITMIPVPSTEELALLNRLQPEVQRVNNWLQDRITALQAENERLRDELRQSSIDHTRAEVERLREAFRAETARCAKVCEDAAKQYEEANRHYWTAGLDVAVRALQNAAADILKGAA